MPVRRLLVVLLRPRRGRKLLLASTSSMFSVKAAVVSRVLRRIILAQPHSSLGSVGMYSVNEHDVPPNASETPREGRVGHSNNNTTERTRRESGFSKLSRSTQCGTHSAFIELPDMVVWAVYAYMLGRTERSARLREPSFTPN
jgi:hypothetical protein